MSKNTEENLKSFEEKLKYIGLDLNNIPKFLEKFEPLGFNPSNTLKDTEHKVYKYVPIDKIQFLISPTNRLDGIKEKYAKAKPISVYLNEKNLEEYTNFLKMLSLTSIKKIEEIEEKQESLNKKIPFEIVFDKNYEWQIYYSEITNNYFMLITTGDYEFEAFFYLLKKQIKYYKRKTKEPPKIYVPINHIDYSGEVLKKSEISDLENYLWLFTKNWPNIYEVCDKKDNVSIHIIGKTYVYKSVKSTYKIVLKDKESAIKYYKQLKALFILQTELVFYYKFITKINNKNELELYYENKKIDYNNLSNFIKEEYIKVEKQIIEDKQKAYKLEKELKNLKNEIMLKDLEYIEKQKEISTYLEYKKTFLGKVKLFFKYKKKDNDKKIEPVKKKIEEKDEEIKINIENEDEEKEFFTIEDLVTIYSKLTKETKNVKNMNSDIKAIKLRLKNMEKKIENATLYIKEIDKHKKSIFEFWKFVNKDEVVALEEADEIEQEDSKSGLKKVFDFNLDFEQLGMNVDKAQRKKLEKKHHDAIFIADTDILPLMNLIKTGKEEVLDKKIKDKLDELKEEAKKVKTFYDVEDFDIFGSISDNGNKLKTLDNKRHRENEKEKMKILDVRKNMEEVELKENLKEKVDLIEKGMGKISSPYDMSIYKASKNKTINKNELAVYNITPENALKTANDKDEVYLYKINIKEKMPILFYSNIIYYDNFNKTLPIGMNVSEKVLIDMEKFTYKLKAMHDFKTNENFEDENNYNEIKIKNVIVLEYDVKLKNEKGEKKADD